MKLLKNGNFMILCSALLFSLGGMCVKLIPWSALSINGVRCAISCLMLFLYLKLTGGRVKFTKGVFIGAFCAFGTTTLYIFANQHTTAANAILIQYASPVYIIIMMWLLFQEKPRRLDVIVGIAVFLGIACFVMDGLGTGRMLGNILALISGMTFAGVFMVNKIPGGDSFSATIIGQFAAGLLGIPALFQERDFSVQPVALILVMGIFQMGLGYLCFCIGIKKTAPVTASLISGVEPIMNPLLAALVVGEMISPISAVGGLVVLGAITIYNVLLAKNRPVAEDLDSIQAIKGQGDSQ